MGKTFETKARILQLLKSGPKTPTDIANELSLAPSTVSQHLKELREMGQIEEGYDEHFKNIKYFALAGQSPSRDAYGPTGIRNPIFRYGIGAIIIIAIIAGLFLAFNNGGIAAAIPGAASYKYVQLSLTDPPQVPNGTTSLEMGYSGMQVLTNGSQSWEELNYSGQVDLMSLINNSQVIGNARIAADSRITTLRFNITNATITINGERYQVSVPRSGVVVTVANNTTGQNSMVLLDFSPIVAAIFANATSNTTSFVMEPYIRAIVLPGISAESYANASAKDDGRRPLNATVRQALRQQPAIAILNASLISAPNSTIISLVVEDNSTQSVTLRHVFVYGEENLSANISFAAMPLYKVQKAAFDGLGGLGQMLGNLSIDANGGASAKANGQPGNGQSGPIGDSSSNGSADGGNGNGNDGMHTGMGIGLGTSLRLNESQLGDLLSSKLEGNTVNLNVTAATTGDSGVLARLNISERERLMANANITSNMLTMQEHYSMLNFNVRSDGALYLPYSKGDFEGDDSGSGSGFTLQPGQKATLYFNGPINLAGQRLQISLIPNDSYGIVVQAEEGARASANALAKSG